VRNGQDRPQCPEERDEKERKGGRQHGGKLEERLRGIIKSEPPEIKPEQSGVRTAATQYYKDQGTYIAVY
jgi:hypothetical protein